MLRFVSKSAVVRLFIYLLVLGLILSAIWAYGYYFLAFESVPYEYLLVLVGICLLLMLIPVYLLMIRPLRIVLREMQALLSAHPYRKIFTDRVDEVGILAHFFNSVTEGLGKATYDINDRARMHGELEVASELQGDILPNSNPDFKGIYIVAKNKPASELGGDSFGFIDGKDSKKYIYIGDVTGHGAAAGFLMSMVSTLIAVFADISDNAHSVLVNVNTYLKKWVKKAMFMTLVMLSWDEANQKLSYVGAGHEHILIYRSKTGECESIKSGGIALGMVADNSELIKESEIALEEGDFVVLYTDGITEAKNDAGELYGLDRLIEAVKEYAKTYSADGVNFHIAMAVSNFMEKHSQEDDMTLIVLQKVAKDVGLKTASSTSWD
ncbi:SpoIIE family protein phosphatase [Patescibacteria group bacterium]|nr:SpoIIE family protein phosphatase [Patescibacteria group bacterium]